MCSTDLGHGLEHAPSRPPDVTVLVRLEGDRLNFVGELLHDEVLKLGLHGLVAVFLVIHVMHKGETTSNIF